jgi:hypothetical protein
VHYKGYVTKVFKPLHKYKILSFKIHGLKYRLNYKIQVKFFVVNSSVLYIVRSIEQQ